MNSEFGLLFSPIALSALGSFTLNLSFLSFERSPEIPHSNTRVVVFVNIK
ncbi:MAG: hypothetical protein AB4290_11795 [Spirulina sp.]